MEFMSCIYIDYIDCTGAPNKVATECTWTILVLQEGNMAATSHHHSKPSTHLSARVHSHAHIYCIAPLEHLFSYFRVNHPSVRRVGESEKFSSGIAWCFLSIRKRRCANRDILLLSAEKAPQTKSSHTVDAFNSRRVKQPAFQPGWWIARGVSSGLLSAVRWVYQRLEMSGLLSGD